MDEHRLIRTFQKSGHLQMVDPHVSYMADRIRRDAVSGIRLDDDLRSRVMHAWRTGNGRDEAELIMDKYPGDFPLRGTRAAD